jgi:peptidylprolyl isomerase
VRRNLAIVLASALALLLAGCGSGSDGGLDAVKVSDSKNPAVTVPTDFTADSTETRVLAEGSGPEVKDGDTVKLNYVAVNGRTGKQFDNSFKAESPLTTQLKEGSVLSGFVKGLTGQKVGSRVLVAIPPKDGFADGASRSQAEQTLGVKADDTMVFLFDIVSKVPTEATGTAEKLPDTVPSITLKDDKPAGFETSDDVTKDPKEPKAYVAIKGDGEKVEKGASITAQYVGQVYPDGKVFDSSWSRGTPSTFSLDQVIACWKDLIPGQTLGSRVVLVCPADSAYGDNPQPGSDIKAGDTLVFAIDLLDAS